MNFKRCSLIREFCEVIIKSNRANHVDVTTLATEPRDRKDHALIYRCLGSRSIDVIAISINKVLDQLNAFDNIYKTLSQTLYLPRYITPNRVHNDVNRSEIPILQSVPAPPTPVSPFKPHPQGLAPEIP